MEHRLQQALRISLITGGWSVVILYVFASPVLTLMYGSGQRNSIHSTSCALLFISLFPKSTYLCFASFKLSKSRNDEYIYWCHREINRYFCTSIKARISNDGVALAIAANIVTVTFLHYATVLKDYIYHLRKRLYFRRTRHRYRRRLRFYLHKYIIFSHALGIQTLWEITLTTIVYIVLSSLSNSFEKKS